MPSEKMITHKHRLEVIHINNIITFNDVSQTVSTCLTHTCGQDTTVYVVRPRVASRTRSITTPVSDGNYSERRSDLKCNFHKK